MNRRSFLTTAGAAAAVVPIFGQISTPHISAPHTPPRRVNSGGQLLIPTTQLIEAKAMHAVAIADRYKSIHHAQDYYNIASASSAVLTMWKQYDVDATLKPAYNSVTESMLTTDRMNIAAITAAVNVYNPAVTQAQMASNINHMLSQTVLGGVDYKTQVLNGIRTSGLAGYIKIAIDNAVELGNGLNPAVPAPTSQSVGASKITADGGANPPHIEKTPVCTYSAWGLLASGLAFAVLTVMTDGLDLIAIAGWEAIQFWTGTALAGWSAVHAIGCGVS